MATRMPDLRTARLTIRAFTGEDLAAVHRLLDVELGFQPGADPPLSFEQRRAWLEWTVMGYEQLALLFQPPYGDRAIALGRDGPLIGACGFVPSLGPFEQLPSFAARVGAAGPQRFTPEVGLFWALASAHRGRGYATEAARALVDYGFARLGLDRLVATTERENAASQAVMRRLGMTIEANPLPHPEWFQVVGVLRNPAGAA